MRKTLLLAGSALVIATASACGSGTESPATTTSSTTPSTSTTTPASTPGVTAPESTTVPMMPNPNGDGSMVPCEGTICTNPNHGAGDHPEGDAPPEPGQTEMEGPDDADAPPEPGQTEMEGPSEDGPPEPGQTDMEG